MITVLLVDDHALIRAGIRQFLEKDADIDVIGECGDGMSAQAFVARQSVLPDLFLVDIQMPQMSGIGFTRWLKETHPNAKVLILTAFDDAPYVSAVLSAGADGYILKTATPTELIQAVKNVHVGSPALSNAVAETHQQHLLAERIEPIHLTQRETEVLQLALGGATNKEIGSQLHLSSRTVQSHFAKIFRKLSVNTRTEAVAEAIRLGVIVQHG